MKKTLLSISFILSILMLKAQDIPNNSFENWDSTQAGCYLPTSWEPIFMFCSSPNISKVADPYHGSYALKMYWSTIYSTLMGGSVSANFAITGRPNSFRMHIKGNFSNNSILNASTILYQDGEIIGAGSFSIENVPAFYTEVGGNFSYMSEESVADSAWIILAIGGDSVTIEGDELLVDNIRFDSEILSVSENDKLNVANIFPNPCSEKVSINSFNAISKIELFDIAGRKNMRFDANGQNTASIWVNEFKNGVYFVRVSYKNGQTENHKLIISR